MGFMPGSIYLGFFNDFKIFSGCVRYGKELLWTFLEKGGGENTLWSK